MNPTNSHERAPRRDVLINGLRPSPLKINKQSHAINKTSQHQQQRQQRQGPVIIYTHSPKIIHTQARDFMALVQRLTGFSRPDAETETQAQAEAALPSKNKIETEDNDSSSALTDENVNINANHNQFFSDIPLFTPNSADFFCSPRPLFRFADNNNAILSPNLNSPSLLEFMKGLSDC